MVKPQYMLNYLYTLKYIYRNINMDLIYYKLKGVASQYPYGQFENVIFKC